ncbi:hypothetical protein VitviT2T_030753 [Vitis vinifera]|uniref:BED-type domain-containing protein n=1 Tax=Vitis vinifera TaxID=29760 RepID=A0ABY9E5W3_VITVI|nr:hypothetical protein VitviT2T_030753 [Vitis vinifera]
MASGSGSGSGGGGRDRGGDGGGGCGTFGRDLAWKYCSPLEGNRNGTICNFCGLVMKSGGTSRFKYHLAHRDLNNNTKKFLLVPLEVKEEIREMLHEKSKAKAKKIADIEEIRDQLRGTMGPKHTNVMDEDDDDDDDDDDEVYMYPTNMDLDERDAYREAIMSNIAKLEFVVLDISGKNYLSWVLDAEIHLDAMNLGNTIKEGNDASLQDRARALVFLHHHIDE